MKNKVIDKSNAKKQQMRTRSKGMDGGVGSGYHNQSQFPKRRKKN